MGESAGLLFCSACDSLSVQGPKKYWYRWSSTWYLSWAKLRTAQPAFFYSSQNAVYVRAKSAPV